MSIKKLRWSRLLYQLRQPLHTHTDISFKFLWELRRKLHLSPTQQVFRELKKRNIRLRDLVALEAFGHTGEIHTKDYANQISSLDVWEIDPIHEIALKRNLPMANITITNAYAEMKKTLKKYNLIVIDNPEHVHGGHYEHFDLYPDIFRLAMNSCILIMVVIPGLADAPRLFDPEHLAKRKSFYKTNHPEKVSFDEMVQAYKTLIEANGFELEWYFFQQRTLDARLFYLVVKIIKTQK